MAQFGADRARFSGSGGLYVKSIRTKIRRLIEDRMIEKVEDKNEKNLYKKIRNLIA